MPLITLAFDHKARQLWELAVTIACMFVDSRFMHVVQVLDLDVLELWCVVAIPHGFDVKGGTQELFADHRRAQIFELLLSSL